ncbi:lysylphosphatidylglycerol synthase transmembrane domain-containing protein [Endothiovibrio diazotrophicus]
MSPLLRRTTQALFGVAVGALFLWLALRGQSWERLEGLARQLQMGWIAAAVAGYFVAMALRTARWQQLLRQLQPEIRTGAVAETLLLGYAVNNLLPARLGELFRADYAKRRFAMPRSTVLGTIVLERVLDGVTVVLFLAGGLLLVGSAEAQRLPLWSAAGAGLALFGLLLVGGWLIGGLAERGPPLPRLPRPLAQRAGNFARAIGILRRRAILGAALLSPLIWLCEAAALWCVLYALALPLAPGGALMLTGAVSLSTLIPTAPGYLGTLQYAFQLGLSAIGHDGSVGVIAATAMQLFLYGSLTAVAALLWAWRLLNGVRAPR